jgi:hypothetical protein
MTNALEPWREHPRMMTTCRIAGFAIGGIVLGIVLSQIPDIIRYIRISSM